MRVLTSGQAHRQGTTGIDPYVVYNKNKNEIKNYYKNKAKTLDGYNLSPEAHNKAMAQIQEESNEVRFKFTSTRLQLDDIKQGMASGQIDPMNGQQAMMQLVAPQGTVEAMFPKPQKQPTVRHGRFSPQQLKTFGENFKEVSKTAIVNPPGWGKSQRKQADPEKLEENYFMFRESDGYDDMTTTQKKQYDKRYDASMNVNPRIGKVWRPMVAEGGNTEIRMARTYGNRFLETAVAGAQGKPITQKKDPVSPFAGAFKKIAIGALGVNPLGGMAARRWMGGKRKAIENRLPTVSTDADYDKLPSGAQFTDPQGNVRTKP